MACGRRCPAPAIAPPEPTLMATVNRTWPSNTGQGVSILLGTGSAKAPFTAGQSLTLSNAGCLLAADLNGDHIPGPGGASTRRRGCLPQQRQWHLHAQELHAGLDGHGRCNASRFQPGREAGFRHHRKLSGARQWRWHVPNARAADYEPPTIRIYRYRRGRAEQRRLAGPGAHQWRN